MKSLSLNEKRLIELVFNQPGIARVDMAKQLGITGASVTRLVAGLIDVGLFIEETDRQGRTGQPKKTLKLKADRFYSAGLSFSLSDMEIALLDFTGEIKASSTQSISGLTTVQIAASAHAEITKLRKKQKLADERFIGLGCSAPGNFAPNGTDIFAHPLFADFGDPEKVNEFKSYFDCEVYLENDGSAAALGEYMFGRQPDDGTSMYLIHIGYGLGGGAVFDGRLFRGSSGNACLPGVLFPYDEPRPTLQDLLAHLNRQDEVAIDLNTDMANHQDQIVQWTKRAAQQLRFAVRVATGFLDPSMIVLGGRLPDEINNALVEEIASEPLEGPSRGLSVAPVRASSLGYKAGAIGAACIPIFETFFSGSTWDHGNNHLNGRRDF